MIQCPNRVYGNNTTLKDICPLSAIFIILRNLIFKRRWPNCALASINQTSHLMHDTAYQSASLVHTVHSNSTPMESSGIGWRISKKIIVIMVFELWTKQKTPIHSPEGESKSISSRLYSKFDWWKPKRCFALSVIPQNYENRRKAR